MEPSREHPHAPGPSLWPVGFAVGIVVLLVGLVVSLSIVGVGAIIATIFATLWVRDLARGSGLTEAPEVEPETRADRERAPALVDVRPESRYSRSVFLELSTLGLGGVIGGLVTVPALGFMIGPAFLKQGEPDHDLGPLSDFPEGKFVITTFMADPKQGFVSRRTAFVRNNGFLGNLPSFTIISNHCAHLGCPVQPNGDPGKPKQYKDVTTRMVQPSGFGCPCHGGQYDTEGNRTAGPPGPRARPVRVLDPQRPSLRREGVLGLPCRRRGRRRQDPQADARVPRRARRRDRVLVVSDPTSPLMAARSPSRQERIMYPLDWLEERSGLVGGVRYFLFRKVPADINWFQTLGSATLTAFIVQAVTGVILAMYYQPGPATAYPSIQHITNDVWAGWLVRGMHKWGASVFIILMFLHMGRVFLFGAYKYPRELNWIVGVLLLALGLAEGFTGYLLPWDQTSYWATTVGINLNGTAPFLGPFLAQFLQGGTYINADTLSRFYAIHMLLLPGAIAGLIGLHLYLVIRLGVTSPPWSKEAAGTGQVAAPDSEWPDRPDPACAARRPRPAGRLRWVATGSPSARRSSSSTRKTSRSGGSRSTPTRCSTTRSCRSSSWS